MLALQNADRQLSGTLSRFQTTIDNYKQDIANEKRRLERDVEAEQRPIRERIEKYENEMGKLVIRQKDANDAGRECETERKALVERLGPLKEAREHAIGDAKKVEERINNFNRMKTNPLTAYGPNVPAFMRAIDQERGWRVKPVGPLGQHVKLVADPRFGKIIEDFFGESLNAFVTTNHEDRAKLFQMHKQHRL